MSLLYRAIWEDDRPELCRVGEDEFLRWARRKGFAMDALTDGETRGTTRYGPRSAERVGPAEFVVRRANAEGREASLLRFIETRPELGERWTTTLTITAPEGHAGGVFWVDIERVSDDPFTRPQFRAPRVTIDLIKSGGTQDGDPRVGHVRLPDSPIAFDAAGLAGLVRNEDRRISLAVFSHDEDLGYRSTMSRADAAFVRLCGVALIVVLPPDQVTAFKALVGDDLAVWGGAARLYLPNQGAKGLQPQRHRYVAASRMKRDDSAADYFVQLLSATVPATPPPSDWEVVRRALDLAGSAETTEYLEYVLDDNTQLQKELETLRVDLAERDYQIGLSQLETEDLQLEVNRQARAIASITHSMRPEAGGGIDAELPAEVGSIAEVLDLAGQLPGIVIHPQAVRDVEKLDSATTATAWANATWQGLRALDAYTRNDGGIAGGFWEWCSRTDSAWKWPATSKKLAMKESETVINRRRTREERELPVDTAVDERGKVLMQAHLKIAEGGGPLAPRVYFYDDTKGATGKIHVGFLGPHEHMSNTRTN